MQTQKPFTSGQHLPHLLHKLITHLQLIFYEVRIIIIHHATPESIPGLILSNSFSLL